MTPPWSHAWGLPTPSVAGLSTLHFYRPRPACYVEVRGSPECGYFVPGCVWCRRQARFGPCSRIGACVFVDFRYLPPPTHLHPPPLLVGGLRPPGGSAARDTFFAVVPHPIICVVRGDRYITSLGQSCYLLMHSSSKRANVENGFAGLSARARPDTPKTTKTNIKLSQE